MTLSTTPVVGSRSTCDVPAAAVPPNAASSNPRAPNTIAPTGATSRIWRNGRLLVCTGLPDAPWYASAAQTSMEGPEILRSAAECVDDEGAPRFEAVAHGLDLVRLDEGPAQLVRFPNGDIPAARIGEVHQ